MEVNLIERRVLVCFKENAAEETIENFYRGLEELKDITLGLVDFKIRHFESVNNEDQLNAAVPNVTFPNIMTIWTFENEKYLHQFLTSEKHLDIAKEKFKPAVERRIVFNSRP